MRTDLTDLLAAPDAVVAVVGATDDPEKYGSIVYRNLKRYGFTVRAVNPGRVTVDGDLAYPDLASLPERPTVIDMVVPAAVGSTVIDEAVGLGYDNVWLQPGAESQELLERLEASGLHYQVDACIMVRARGVRP